MGIFERHPTGATIVVFVLLVLVLSALPLPDQLRPLDVFQQEQPIEALASLVFKRSEPIHKKGDVAAADFALHEDDAPDEDDQPKPELAVVHVDTLQQVERPKVEPWKKPVRPKLDTWRPKLNFAAKELEEYCAEPIGGEKGACTRWALDRFFDRLDRAYDRELDDAVARVVHYGDSIIASDHITDVVRLRLQERFGSAGKGFLLVTRYNQRQRRLRTGEGKDWKPMHIAEGDLPDHDFGYAGSAFTAEKNDAATVFENIGESRFAEIYYLQQADGGPIEIFADDKSVKRFETNGATRAAKIEAVELPEKTKAMKLVAAKAGTRVFGVALEAHVPGVIYESIGVPGSTSEVWLSLEKSGFDAQLSHRDPALVVTMLGGNDARSVHQKKKTLEQVDTTTRDFIRALKAAAPHSDCLIVSPIDGVQAKSSGEMKSKPEIPKVIEVQKKVAREEGCAFWDMYASMGGAGSLEKWFKAGLFNPDLIHPKAAAGDIIGEMMAEALMNAYDARHTEQAQLDHGGGR